MQYDFNANVTIAFLLLLPTSVSAFKKYNSQMMLQVRLMFQNQDRF